MVKVKTEQKISHSPQCDLTDKQKSAIHQLSTDCAGYLQRGRKIVEHLKLGKDEAAHRLEAILNDTEKKLQKLNKFISDKDTACPKGSTVLGGVIGGAAGGVIGGAAAATGTAIGFGIGVPFCVVDAGATAIVLGIIGGTVGMYVSSCGIKLGPLLSSIIDNINKIQRQVADAYTFKSKFLKQN